MRDQRQTLSKERDGPPRPVLASLAGAPIALTGEPSGVAGRTNIAVTLGALAALGVGTWTGRTAVAPTNSPTRGSR